MAAADEKDETTRRTRAAGLLGAFGRGNGNGSGNGDADGKAPDAPVPAQQSRDALPTEHMLTVEAYVDCYPKDDDDRNRANEDLRGYARERLDAAAG